MDKVKKQFPLIEAMLLTPKEGDSGNIGICTNTSAPGQIINDIDQKHRKHISVLGSLIVSRDGAERMIINSLIHPTLKYLVLFSEESITFAPSTNILQAIMHGFEPKKIGNYIKGGVAASPHYPSIKNNVFNTFKKEILVIPAFMHKGTRSKEILNEYLKWLKPKISPKLHKLLLEINNKEKIYFDSLNKIIGSISELPPKKKTKIDLDSKDFQHLQPPKIELDNVSKKFDTPFKITRQNQNLRLDIQFDGSNYFIIGEDPFVVAYSFMKYIGDKKALISSIDQIVLGAELGRVSVEIGNGIKFSSFVLPKNIKGREEILLEPATALIADKKYYYKINTRGSKISAMCLSFDVCESVFELLSETLPSIAEKIAKENRFEEYRMDILHRIDVGIELGKATVAAKLGYSFIQDFSAIFKINKEILPSLIVGGDSFLDVHKGILRGIYTQGITEEHGDSWKGMTRSASVLAVFRNAEKALEKMPTLYRQGDQDSATVRENYKCELLRLDHDGTYTYGERTRTYFGFDQLEKTKEVLKKNPKRAAVIQRFDPVKDMTMYTEPETGKTKFTHDPCLTHDIFFILNKKLHSFHIARAHNATNAYPENIFGLFDAYTTPIRNALHLKSGDMYMLSNRANILLLTEEQRTKKILGEPSKPQEEMNISSGPYKLGNNIKKPSIEGAVTYYYADMKKETIKPGHSSLKKIESYKGVNTLEKATEYLKIKGGMHNNPILTEYYAKEDNPQADQLVFFQANVFGKKVYSTAVFANRSIKNLEKDKKFMNYVSTQFSKKLKAKLGSMSIYYVAYRL